LVSQYSLCIIISSSIIITIIKLLLNYIKKALISNLR